MSHNFFQLCYPDCMYKSSASPQLPNPFQSNDVRAMFYDAKMTSRPVPTANAWDLTWPLVPPASSNVSITSRMPRLLRENNWHGAYKDDSRDSDYINSGTIYGYGGVGYSYPSSSYVYYREPSSFRMAVAIPPAIRQWVSSDVTVIVFVLQICAMYDRFFGDQYHDDLFAFPFSKTVDTYGQAIITLSDIQRVINATSASLTERDYIEFYWYGNKFMTVRQNYILACPLVCRLKDHTDFSSLNWQWTP